MGTKCDVVEEREVSPELINEFCVKHHLVCFETSAKLSINVDEAFSFLIDQILSNKGGACAPDMTGRNLAVLGHSLFWYKRLC